MDNPGIKWGIYLGIASVAVSLILYLVNPIWMYQSPAVLAGLVITILFLVLAGKEKREDLGGYASFGQVFPTLFLVSIISAVISVIFGYILMNVIDPGLIDVQKEASMDSTRWILELMGVEGDDMDAALEATAEELDKQEFGGVKQMMTGLIAAGFFGAFISAIVSLFVKKKDPESDTL